MKNHLTRHAHMLAAVALVLLLPLCLHSGLLASEVLIYALAAMGCNLLLGYTGLLSFGQGIFFGLGSYSAALVLLRTGLPWPMAVLAAIFVGALGAALVGVVAIRQRGPYFVMLTMAFSQMFYFLAYSATEWTGGDNGLLDVPHPADSAWQYYSIVAVLFLLVFWWLRRVCHSVFGRTLLAVRDREERAAAIGYNLLHLKLLAFVISGAVTGLAGALMAMMTGIAPLSSIEYLTSEMILVMTVIGGTGNLLASVLGAAFYVLLGDWLSGIWPRWLLLLGVVLMVISLGLQRGLWGLGENVWQLWRRKAKEEISPAQKVVHE